MSSIWTVTPGTTRKEGEFAGHAYWIDLKNELTTGEQKMLEGAGLEAITARRSDVKRKGGSNDSMDVKLDWASVDMQKVLVWLADWSFSDDKGNKLALSMDTIKAFRVPLFNSVEKLVKEHEKQVAKDMLSKKPEEVPGEPASKTTS